MNGFVKNKEILSRTAWRWVKEIGCIPTSEVVLTWLELLSAIFWSMYTLGWPVHYINIILRSSKAMVWFFSKTFHSFYSQYLIGHCVYCILCSKMTNLHAIKTNHQSNTTLWWGNTCILTIHSRAKQFLISYTRENCLHLAVTSI